MRLGRSIALRGFSSVVAVTAMLVGAGAPSLAGTTVAPTPAVSTTSAPHVGVISVAPATGNDLLAFALVSSKGCPPGGTNVIGTIFGPGLPDTGINIVPNTTAALFPHTAGGGLYLPSNNTLRSLVDQLPDPQALKGTYRLRVECRGPAKVADLGEFSGSMVFDGHHHYVANEPDVPKGSLNTIAAPSGLPIPTAVGSEAPAPAKSPVTVRAQPAAATENTKKSSGGVGLWLICGGALIAAVGLASLMRDRRARRARARL